MSLRRAAASLVLVLVGATATTLTLTNPAAAEQRSASGYVTMVSESGDWVGGGVSRSYRGTFSFYDNGTAVHLSAGPFTFDFVAPAGRALTPGLYPGATRYPFQEAGEPGLDVSGDGRGCNELTGAFTVLDIAPDRLWIAYEQHCEGGDPALFGEIRLGYGEAASPLGVEAGILGFPSEYPGVPVRPVPVRVANNGSTATQVTAAVVAGGADYEIVSNACPSPLAPGSACTVHLGFTPSRGGTRLGLVHIADDRGNLREVALSGVGISGRTEWHMKGDAGDYISGGRSYDYVPTTGARMGGYGVETYAAMGVEYANDWWSASFEAPVGQILLPGHTYTGATRYPFNSGNAGLDVSGSGRGCNELSGQFTVHEATYDEGWMTGFRISFEQHCEHSSAALRGEVSWRAYDPDAPTPDTTPPGPVDNLTAGAPGASVPLSWTNPTASDWVDTVVLGRSGTAPSTQGRLHYDGRLTSTVVSGFPTWLPYTVTVFAEDTSGNLSPLRSVTIPATTSPPPDTATGSASPSPTAPGPTTPDSVTTPVPTVRSVALQADRVLRREVRIRGRAGAWAAGERALLPRRRDGRWTTVAARRFSASGLVRWRLRLAPRARPRFRLVTRVGGQRLVSAPVRVPRWKR